jgi:hypothetical protein
MALTLTIPAETLMDFRPVVEILTVDEESASMVEAIGKLHFDLLSISEIPGADEIHISIIVATSIERARRVAMTLIKNRFLVFSILIGKAVPDGFPGPYTLCSAQPERLGQLLIALLGGLIDHTLIGVDLSDMALVLRPPPDISRSFRFRLREASHSLLFPKS